MEAAKKVLRVVAVALTAMGAVCALLMMVHVTADVIGRYVFNKPVTATLETVEHIYMVCLTFMPLALIQMDREHLLIELFIEDVDSAIGRVANVFSSLIGLAICGLIAWKTIGTAIAKTRIVEVVYLVDVFMPVWWVRWIVALAFSLCTLILALQVVEDARRFGQPRHSSSPHADPTAIHHSVE